MVLQKIACEDKKNTELSNSYIQSLIKSEPLKLIEKICTRFLIEINYLGYISPLIEMLALGND